MRTAEFPESQCPDRICLGVRKMGLLVSELGREKV